MKSLKRNFLIIMCVCMMGVLAACGTNDSNEMKDTSNTQEHSDENIVEDTMDGVGNGVNDVVDGIGNGVNDVVDGVENATDDLTDNNVSNHSNKTEENNKKK